MKKLLFVAALGVAGLMSAKEAPSKNTERENMKMETTEVVNQKEAVNSIALLYAWYKVTSPCGAVYYLDMDQYSNDDCGQIDFYSDVIKFNSIKCGGNGGLDSSIYP